MEKVCVKCGIILCKNNIYTTPASPKYNCKKCKHCRINAKECALKYNNEALNKLSKKQNKKIDSKIHQFKAKRKNFLSFIENATTCQLCGLFHPRKGFYAQNVKTCKCNTKENTKKFCKIYYKDPELELLSIKRCDYLTRKIRQSKAWLVRKQCEAYIKKRKEQQAIWRKLPINIEKVKINSRRKSEKDVTMLRDNYVAGVLTYDCPILKKHITSELIELKRKQLKLYRDVKSKKRNSRTDNNCNNS